MVKVFMMNRKFYLTYLYAVIFLYFLPENTVKAGIPFETRLEHFVQQGSDLVKNGVPYLLERIKRSFQSAMTEDLVHRAVDGEMTKISITDVISETDTSSGASQTDSSMSTSQTDSTTATTTTKRKRS